jgi:hypothetical protein
LKAKDYKTFEEFRAAPNAVAIFYGDWGGQVYASVPMRRFLPEMGNKEIHDLGIKLEEVCWDCNVTEDDPKGGAMVGFQIKEPGTGVTGGMGGGWVGEDVWLSPDINDKARNLIKEKLSDAA